MQALLTMPTCSAWLIIGGVRADYTGPWRSGQRTQRLGWCGARRTACREGRLRQAMSCHVGRFLSRGEEGGRWPRTDYYYRG